MSVIKIRDKETGEFIDIPALQGEGGIPVPSTAEVGQTIVVKSVDSNGKPTAWEAADFPSGGKKYINICIHSSWTPMCLLVEEGMTWAEWIESKYNIAGVHTDGQEIIDGQGGAVALSGTTVGATPQDVIRPGSYTEY